MFRSRRNQALLTIVLFLGALVPGVRVLGRWDSAPSVHSAIQVTTAAQHVTNSGARAVTGSTQELTREPAATITTSSNAIVGDVSGPLVGDSLPVEPRARSDNPDAGRWVVVYFSFACHSVSPKTAKAINHYLAAVPYGATVTVEGHTDHIGTLESNMRLSGKRALAVSSVLPRDRWKLRCLERSESPVQPRVTCTLTARTMWGTAPEPPCRGPASLRRPTPCSFAPAIRSGAVRVSNHHAPGPATGARGDPH